MMRRSATLLAGIAMLAGIASGAQARCTSERDQSAFDVGALKSELSVLAVGCGDEEDYNGFVTRDRSELVAEDAVVNAWFKKTYGRSAQSQYDSYITLLANEQSVSGQHEGSEFCPRLKTLFSEAAIVPVTDLPKYAAAKNLLPKDLACEPVGASTAPSRATTSRKKK